MTPARPGCGRRPRTVSHVDSSATRCARSCGSPFDQLSKQLVDWHPPNRQGWLGIGNFPSSVEGWMVWIARPIHPDRIMTKQIDIPHHKGAGGKIVSAFLSQSPLCRRAIIVFASDLNGEDRCPFKESHVSMCAGI